MNTTKTLTPVQHREQWVKELMKWNKKDLIEQYEKQLIAGEAMKELLERLAAQRKWNYLPENLKAIIDEAQQLLNKINS